MSDRRALNRRRRHRRCSCNVDCQRRHYKQHKEECDIISKLSGEFRAHFDAQSLLAARIARWLIAEHDEARANELLVLQTHIDKQPASVMEGVHRRAAVVSKFLQLAGAPDVKYVSVPYITAIMATLWVNSIGVHDEEELATIGIALYPRLSLLNHSCQPNCVLAFRGTTALLRPLRRLAAGEELTIAYCDVVDSRAARQALLAQQYFFACRCERCALPPSADHVDVALAGASPCTRCAAVACDECRAQTATALAALQSILTLTDFDAAVRENEAVVRRSLCR